MRGMAVATIVWSMAAKNRVNCKPIIVATSCPLLKLLKLGLAEAAVSPAEADTSEPLESTTIATFRNQANCSRIADAPTYTRANIRSFKGRAIIPMLISLGFPGGLFRDRSRVLSRIVSILTLAGRTPLPECCLIVFPTCSFCLR